MGNIFWINGRDSRLKWWILSVVQGIAVALLFFGLSSGDSTGEILDALGPFGIVILVLSSWISICSTIRRYHDRGKSGLWILLGFIPLIGPIWQFVELGFLSGIEGDNEYGPPSEGFSS